MLIDDFLPSYEFAEHHAMEVRAPAEAVHAAIWDTNLAGPLVVKILFTLRGLAFSLRKPKLDVRLQDLLDSGFILLADRPTEIVIGLVGRFWRPTGGLTRIPPADFTSFDRPGMAKAITNFAINIHGDVTTLTTETRIAPIGEDARRSFARYWRVIGPFSGLIRSRWLTSVKKTAEAGTHEEVLDERR